MSTSPILKKYFVNINGDRKPFDRFDEAARFWTGQTFHGPSPVGGIEVQEFQHGVMVRDGWVVHVHENGSVFINPIGA
jgi:hypothetical protein